jgi:chemotaxis protein MotB
MLTLLGGCVSTGTFEQMEAGKNQEIADLHGKLAALEKEKADLQKQTADLQQLTATEQQQLAALEQQQRVAQQQILTLEQQKETLISTSQQTQQQYQSLVQGLAKEVEKGQIQVRQYQNMLSVDLAEQIFFDSGSAVLKAEGKEVLKKVGAALKSYEEKIIRVVGHMDNVPLAKSLREVFPSNWELSVARSTTVVRFLQEVGVPPERMIPAGRGEYDPIAANDTAEGRKKNRRIEIMLIDKGLAGELNTRANRTVK